MTRIIGLAIAAGVLGLTAATHAQEESDSAAADSASAAAAAVELTPAEKLALEQERIADRFKHLQAVLLRMSELSAATDPRRATLLKKAVSESEERLLGAQFERLVELYRQEKLGDAKENLASLDQDLKTLLALLMSEDRSKRIKSERERIREYLKQLDQIINQQKAIQGRTVGQAETNRLAQDQGKLARRTGELSDQIRAGEEQNGPGESSPDAGEKAAAPPENGKGQEGEEGSQSGEAKPEEGQGTPNKPSSAEGQEGTPGGDGEKAEPTEGQAEGQGQEQSGGKSQGQGQSQSPSQGGSQGEKQGENEQDPSAEQNPARQRLAQARQRMEDAQKELEEARREGAAQKQDEALRELEQAKAQLEEILRQLREEEIERALTMLEARFAKMLQVQREVLEGTERLDKVPAGERDHNHEIEAGRLSSREAEIVTEADRAMTLLREDGTAVAFPEAVEQLRGDMVQVVERLAAAKVDLITQTIENDIITGLEEMLAALKKAIEEARQRQQGAQNQSGQPQDPPLVDMLSEIKMIRTLQLRVNSRTDRYAKLIEGEQALKSDLLESLARLAEQQERIYRITRDLETGKNQ